jgi:hypothetical protein
LAELGIIGIPGASRFETIADRNLPRRQLTEKLNIKIMKRHPFWSRKR